MNFLLGFGAFIAIILLILFLQAIKANSLIIFTAFVAASFLLMMGLKRMYINKSKKVLDAMLPYLQNCEISGELKNTLNGRYKSKAMLITVPFEGFYVRVFIKIFKQLGNYKDRLTIEKRKGEETKFFIGKYIKAEDSYIDENWTIKANNEDKIKSYLLNTKFKAALLDLMSTDFELLEIKGNEISLRYYNPQNLIKKDKIVLMFDKLCDLSYVID